MNQPNQYNQSPDTQPNESNSRSNSETGNKETNANIFQAPKVELPKGGGAIQGIGEKFQANPVTDAGSMIVPIAMNSGIFDEGWLHQSIVLKPLSFDPQFEDIFLEKD